MSSFTIKIIAIITMLIDHLKDGLFPDYYVMNIIGRIAFPLFAFQVAIGYEKTKNVYKYMQRMLIFAIISEFAFYIFSQRFFNGQLVFNVMFTLLFGIMVMHVWDFKVYNKEDENKNINKKDKINQKPKTNKESNLINNIFIWIIKIFIIFTLCYIAEKFKFDYGALGVLFILAIHLLFNRDKKIIFSILYLLYCIYEFRAFFGVVPDGITFLYIAFMYFPIVIMFLYNGKKGPSLKYFFYLFYPIHISIIILLSYIFN